MHLSSLFLSFSDIIIIIINIIIRFWIKSYWILRNYAVKLWTQSNEVLTCTCTDGWKTNANQTGYPLHFLMVRHGSRSNFLQQTHTHIHPNPITPHPSQPPTATLTHIHRHILMCTRALSGQSLMNLNKWIVKSPVLLWCCPGPVVYLLASSTDAPSTSWPLFL